MKSILINLMVISLVLLAAAGVTAKELTLDDCIELALENRASIIRAHGDETLAKAGRMAALGAFLPNLSVYYEYSKSKRSDYKYETEVPGSADTVLIRLYEMDQNTIAGYGSQIVGSDYTVQELTSDPQDYTDKRYGLSARMSLFKLSNWFDLAAAGADRDRARLDVIASEQDMIYSVKTMFYAYLATTENVDVQQEAVKRSEEQLKLIESKYELGSAAKSDVLKQKVQYGRDRQNLLEAKNSATSARADLAYTIGLDPGKDYNFDTNYVIRGYDGSVEQAIDFGHGHRPSLLSSQKSVDAARHQLKSARSGYLPTLTGSYGLSWSKGTSGFTQLFESSNKFSSIGISASWNIFDGFGREYNISRAKVARNNAMASLTEQKYYVTLEIKKAHLDIAKTKEQIKLAEETEESASEDMKMTQEKYNLGAATILDLLDAQVSLKSARVELIRAGFNLNLAVAKLEMAMGKM